MATVYSKSGRLGQLLAATILAGLGLGEAFPAQAQTALDEVVVTARGKGENNQTVPLTITALSKAELTAASATGLQDISFLTPGLVYNSNGAQANASLVIRGISDTSGGEASSSNVSVFLDGIYIKNPSAIDLSIGGVERVEVVEGPVSGLYGRNAFTGAVNYVTQKPTDTFHWNIAETAGTDGKEQVDAGVSGAIIPGILSGRAVGTFDRFDGTYHDSVTGQDAGGHDRKDAMVTLLFTPVPNLSITPVFYYGDDHFDDAPSVYYAQNCALGTSSSYCGSLNNHQIGPYIEAPDGSNSHGLSRRVIHFHADSKYTGTWGTLDFLVGYNSVHTNSFGNYDGSEFGLVDYIYNQAGTNVGTALVPVHFGNVSTEHDTSFSLRYDSPQAYPLRVSLGGYYLNGGSTGASLYSVDLKNVPAGDHILASYGGYGADGNGAAINLGTGRDDTIDLSGFGGGEYDILRNLTLSAVVRYTSEEQKQAASPAELSATFHSVTSNESLTWKPTAHVTAYLSAANGEKSGGFNTYAVAASDLTFQPETDWNYEAGVKTDLLDGHVRLNADVYHMDIDNLQVLGPPSTGVALVVKNYGALSSNGFEASGDYVVGNGLKLSAGLAISHPRFSDGSYDYSDATACLLIPSCAGNRYTNSAASKNLPGINLKGLSPPFESDVVFNTAVEYRHGLGWWNGVDWFVRGDYRYESRQYSAVTDFAYYGPRNIFNLHAGLDGGKWSVTAYVLNVLNDKTPVTEQANGILNTDNSPVYPNMTAVTAGGLYWIPTSVLPDGRTFAVRLAYNF